MKNIEIQSNLVKFIDEKKQYIFDCIRLEEYFHDLQICEAEYIFADITGKYLTIIATIASGQYGIIAVVDINSDEVIHIQDGAFAISATVYNNKVISFHDVVSYGHYPYYTIDVMRLGSMSMEVESKSMKVNYSPEFYDGKNKISMALDGTILKLSNGIVTYTEDIGDLI